MKYSISKIVKNGQLYPGTSDFTTNLNIPNVPPSNTASFDHPWKTYLNSHFSIGIYTSYGYCTSHKNLVSMRDEGICAPGVFFCMCFFNPSAHYVKICTETLHTESYFMSWDGRDHMPTVLSVEVCYMYYIVHIHAHPSWTPTHALTKSSTAFMSHSEDCRYSLLSLHIFLRYNCKELCS